MPEKEKLYGQPEKKEGILIPSRDLAWLIGILAVGGTVTNKRIEIETVQKELLNKFQKVGERIFQINADVADRSHSEEGHGMRVRFYTSRYAGVLGDLRSPTWSNTIIERHAWILQDAKYIWGFLEGVFDRTGFASFRREKGVKVGFYTSYLGNANFIIDLLTRVNINNPKYISELRKESGIVGVEITDAVEVGKLARNIHSVIPNREGKLKVMRQIEVKSKTERDYKRINYMQQEPITDDRLSEEWKRLEGFVRRPLTRVDIQRLRNFGYTPYSSILYAIRFGRGNFEHAKIRLSASMFKQIDHLNAEDIERNDIESGLWQD